MTLISYHKIKKEKNHVSWR